MGKRSSKKKRSAASEEVIPESPLSLDGRDSYDADIEKDYENPTQTEAKTEEPKVIYRKDPRYEVLKDSLKHQLDNSPSMDRVKDNPWLYLEWRTQISRLVQ